MTDKGSSTCLFLFVLYESQHRKPSNIKMIFISKGLKKAIKLLLMTYRPYTMIKSFIKLGTKVFIIIHLYLYLEIGTDGIFLILYFNSPLLR